MVKDYRTLRQATHARDRGLREKVMSLEQAAGLVNDGEHVGIGGCTLSRTPMAMIWALIRARRENLTVSRSITSTEGDLLFASGASRHIITSWFTQGIVWGVSKVMRHHVEAGKAKFDEWSHMAMGMRFRAGAMGVPFLPIRSMLGSDVRRLRPEPVEIDCPFTGERILLVDDIVTTGGSLRAMLPPIEEPGGDLLLAAVLVDRSGSLARVDSPVSGRSYPATALWTLGLPTYEAGAGTCPGCGAGLALEAPGSSGATAAVP